MRAKLFVAGVGLMLLAAVLLSISGCSDSSTNWTAGSETDYDYLMVQDQIDIVIDSAIASFGSGFDSYNLLPTDEEDDDVIIATYAPGGGDVNFTYDYYSSTGWHEIWVANETDYYNMYVRDSVQFQLDDDFVEDALGADYMNYIHNWVYETDAYYQDETHFNWDGRTQLIYQKLDESLCELDGSNLSEFEWNYFADDTTIAAEFTADVSYRNIEFSPVPGYGWVSGCPVSGRMSGTFSQEYTITIDETPVEVSKEWKVTVNFEDGSAKVWITSGNNSWRYTRDICNVVE